MPFSGVKIALIHDHHVLTILRDNLPSLILINGIYQEGGREGLEMPFGYAQREVREELGIGISKDMVVLEKVYQGITSPISDSILW